MAILDDVLQEEYERLSRMKSKMSEEYAALPKGYISKKNIRGNVCYYLQHREGSRVVGQYIKEEDVTDYEAKIERRRSLKKTISDIELQMKKIERAVK